MEEIFLIQESVLKALEKIVDKEVRPQIKSKSLATQITFIL